VVRIGDGVGKTQHLAKSQANARIEPNGGTIIEPKKLSSINPYLRGPNALFLHARNVATSTAVETGKPVEGYIERCLARHEAGGSDSVSERQKVTTESVEPGPKSKGPTKKC
jgi:hypothetical protein